MPNVVLLRLSLTIVATNTHHKKDVSGHTSKELILSSVPRSCSYDAACLRKKAARQLAGVAAHQLHHSIWIDKFAESKSLFSKKTRGRSRAFAHSESGCRRLCWSMVSIFPQGWNARARDSKGHLKAALATEGASYETTLPLLVEISTWGSLHQQLSS